MKTKNKEIVFSNGDPMKPVFCVDGKKYYTDKDVERLIEEYDDRLRVARGSFNLVETLNSFVERDLKKARRALWIARAERAKDRAITCDDFAYLGDTEREINMTLARTWMKCRLLKPSEWSKVWRKVERKCRAKAEEYK